MRQHGWIGMLVVVLVGWMQVRAVHAVDRSHIPVTITVTTVDGTQPLEGVTLHVVDATGGMVTDGTTDAQGTTILMLAVGSYGLVLGGSLTDGTPIQWEPIYQTRGSQPFFVTEAVVPLLILVAPNGIAVVGVSVLGDPLRGPGSQTAVMASTSPPVPIPVSPGPPPAPTDDPGVSVDQAASALLPTVTAVEPRPVLVPPAPVPTDVEPPHGGWWIMGRLIMGVGGVLGWWRRTHKVKQK